jgi:plastocyanin
MSLKSILVAIISVLMSSALLSAGTISGKVTYTGKPPASKTIDMSSEPDCAKQYSTPPTTETVVAGANNVLQNVVVFISAGANDDKTQTQPVILEQKGCRYTPHVLALETGQEMKITNDDQTTHNVHPLAKENREWNRSQPPGAAPLTVKFDKPEFIPVKCNVHPWMRGYIVVLNTSHFAVTGGDGTFALPNLPAGKYTVTAWQEDFGSVTQDVTVTGNETKTVDFNFKGKSN